MTNGAYEVTGDDGENYGPFNVADLQDLLDQGRLNFESPIREFGAEGEWSRVGEILNVNVAGPAFSAAEILDSDHRLSVGNALSAGWRVFTGHMGLLVGANVVYLAILIGSSLVPFIGIIIQLCIAGPLTGGMLILVLNLIRNDSAKFQDLLAGFERCFGKLCGIGIVQWLMAAVVCIPGIILIVLTAVSAGAESEGAGKEAEGIFFAHLFGNPAFYLGVLLLIALGWGMYSLVYFAIPLAADKGLSFFQSFTLSIRIAGRNILRIALLHIIVGIVVMISYIPLLLGLLLSIPWFFTVIASAYEQLFSPEVATSDQ